jgi:response regulator RpfG family c-di-GMP phosphodiesterase
VCERPARRATLWGASAPRPVTLAIAPARRRRTADGSGVGLKARTQWTHDSDVVDGALASARELLGMDAAYVSELGNGRQRFRRVEGDAASFGLGEDTSLALADSFCVRMASRDLPNVVPDTGAEEQVRDLPLTRRARIGAYVGVPVRSPSGDLLGSFCCVSHAPDPALARRDISFMHVLASVVARELERQGRDEAVREQLEGVVEERTAALRAAAAHLEVAQAETVRRLSMAVEYRDQNTGRHIERVSGYSARLAEAAGLDPDHVELVRQASPLHDAGKVGIPDAILLKAGPLSPGERSVMQTHTQLGCELLRGSKSPVLQLAATIALTHHERYDGSGYPGGLRGTAIPIEGRIVAIADVFDALTTERVYRAAFPVDRALRLMQGGREIHFDPVLLDLFVSVARADGLERPR